MKKVSAAKLNDLSNGDMKPVKIDNENEILLCKVNNKYFAVTANCPHYGAPLAEGILHNNIIICPWHHSCFNAENGDLLEPPSLDSLESYEVTIEGDEINILVPDSINRSRIPSMAVYNSEADSRTFVIIGAGAAGNAAAEALRQNGFKGKVIMITKENRFPYDRPNLSKAYLSGEAPGEWMPLRPENFYKDNSIDILLNKNVKEIKLKEKKILFDKNEELFFDKILIATGGVPRKLNIPGNDLKNIFYLRSFSDSDEIIEASKKAENIIIIGASFIGMESAFHLKERTKASVTIITPEEVPFTKIFGKEIGKLLMDSFEKHEITFCTKTKPIQFSGDEKVEAVLLENGEKVKADIVLAGIGVTPSTDFIKSINKEKDNSFKVNNYFQVEGHEDIYAAGDIASFTDWRRGKLTRIEHWRTAEQQGRTAAMNMAGKKKEYKSIPFFWTEQADLKLRYVGHAEKWDEIIIDGEINSKEFIAYYIENKIIAAAAGVNRDKEMAAINELMRLDQIPSPEEIKGKKINILDLMKNN